jgi:hypothetical protein
MTNSEASSNGRHGLSLSNGCKGVQITSNTAPGNGYFSQRNAYGNGIYVEKMKT